MKTFMLFGFFSFPAKGFFDFLDKKSEAKSENSEKWVNPLFLKYQEYVKEEHDVEVEDYVATTKDNYKLHIHRLKGNEGKPVVFMLHGIIDSSWEWVINKSATATGIILWKAGYDVWMGNNRGNDFSREPKDETNAEFWNYSYDEQAECDLPAMVDYVISHTQQPKLTFVGWSNGATLMFANQGDSVPSHLRKCQHRPVEESINLFVALSPIAYDCVLTKWVFGQRWFAELQTQLVSVLNMFALLHWHGIFFSNSDKSRSAAICKVPFFDMFCGLYMGTIVGRSDLDDEAVMNRFWEHIPSGLSVKMLRHYSQQTQFLTDFDKFQRYDYGSEENLKRYGTREIPQYNLKQLKIPTALFQAGHDGFARTSHLLKLSAELKESNKVVYDETYEDFAHLTWVIGKDDAAKRWQPKFLELIKEYATNSNGDTVSANHGQ